ncbi:PREDICTED: uncharacterized protein K02A2.6-like, partial [Diuraphis noxia]|uniref:uncharacterized protein K02A2.6-like n=1 Tax=Diuraphis noxia TaxID=143948 RepID=UPI0007635F79
SVDDITLQNKSINVEAYGGTNIEVIGITKLKMKVLNNKNTMSHEHFIVATNDAVSILGLETFLKLKLINRTQDVFRGVGCFKNPYSIKLKENHTPVSKPPHRVPIKVKEKLREELSRLTELGIISKINEPTSWVNKIVIVEKPNGSIRICLDPKDLNMAIKKKYFSLPTLNDLSAELGKSKIFSCLDLKDGFFHVLLDKKSSEYCTFSTIYGCYSFNRLPFGISVAAEVFQKYNTELFIDIKGVFIYVDDILIHAETEEEHNKILIEVLERARANNIKFSEGKIKPDNSRISAIENYDQPKK